jgi:flagellin
MTVINTNIAASITANSMKANQRVMEQTMERLSTGLRVNSASDDAAGLAIGSKMESQVRGLNQAIRNANDGISMIQTADGAAGKIGDMLQRMRELAVQAQNGTNSASDKTNINKEFAALATEIDRVANVTTFNNQKIMDGTVSSANFNIGADAGDDLAVSFADFNLAAGSNDTKAVYKIGLTAAKINTAGANAIANTSSIIITNDQGDIAQILNSDATDAGATSGFTDVTLAELVVAANAAIDRATGFEGLVAAADGDSLKFTQDVAGTGSVSSLKAVTNVGVQADLGAVTVGTAFGAGGPMGINMISGAGGNFTDATASIAEGSGTIGYIDTAISGLVGARASFGAAISSLEFAIDNLQTGVQNASAAKSAVMDADYASETTELARTQIISQASTAMLSQANQQAQSVLALLK